jgi:hypothetical protein
MSIRPLQNPVLAAASGLGGKYGNRTFTDDGCAAHSAAALLINKES